MSFPAHPYEVDEHLVAGLQALYEATDRLRQVPLTKLDPGTQLMLRETIGRVDAIKDALYLLRSGRERTDDVPPVDLVGVMARRLRPVTKRAFELLADGEWHSYEAVIREAAKEVLPGEAHRYMEASRKARTPDAGDRVKNNDDVYLVERGQRAVAVNAISGNDRIEMDPPRSVRADNRMIRLRPPQLARPKPSSEGEMPEPGAEPVADAAPHAPEHAEVAP